jgi:soluble lytic murein transglycosylase-like protein
VQRFAPLIVKWADQYAIDPDLIAAVMTVESGGNPQAVSRSGACGLMQVMARDTARVLPHLFRDRPTCAELKNPDFNTGWGVHYLAVLYQRNGADWREALYRYGPMDQGYAYADRVWALYQQSK